MRYLMTAFAAISLGALPITAQVPARPTPPNPPAQPAGPPATITEQQRQQHQAIREKYVKEFQVHRDAIQALNEKMRSEIDATLTPEQRELRQRGGGLGIGMGQGGGRGMAMAQGGGRMGGMAPGNGQLQARAMLWRHADRAARQMIAMHDRMMVRAMMQRRGGGRMGQGGMMGGRGGMTGEGDMMGRMHHGDSIGSMAPKQTAPAAKKPSTGGGGA